MKLTHILVTLGIIGLASGVASAKGSRAGKAPAAPKASPAAKPPANASITGYTLGTPPADVVFADICGTGSHAKMGNLDSSLSEEIELPFGFPLYAGRYTKAKVSTDGWLAFSRFLMNSSVRRATGKLTLPDFSAPNAAVYVFWEDLHLRAEDGICFTTVGSAPNRSFVVQWNHAYFENNTTPDGELTFQARLSEDGTVDLLYDKVTAGSGRTDRPASATIGIENEEKRGAETGGTQGLSSPATPSAGLRIRLSPTR